VARFAGRDELGVTAELLVGWDSRAPEHLGVDVQRFRLADDGDGTIDSLGEGAEHVRIRGAHSGQDRREIGGPLRVGLIATGIHYNTKKLQEAGIPAPTSWNDLWDPRLKGKVAFYAFGIAYSQDFLVLMAKLHGGSEDNIQPGLARIKQLRANGNLTTFSTTPAELDNLLTGS
jgi:hypothetical protein